MERRRPGITPTEVPALPREPIANSSHDQAVEGLTLRYFQHKLGKNPHNNWHNDPVNWKWGMFYYNKQDGRLFPPKRSYLGWTINFANLYSILANAILLIIAITAIVLFWQLS